MFRDTRNPESPLYFLGDSNPRSESAEPVLDDPEYALKPLDPRHPTRHNIWTPIFDVVQRRVFVACHGRLDDSKFYIRNAVENPKDRDDAWVRNREIGIFRDLLIEYNPPLVLAFGGFSVEFALHALPENQKPAECWTVWKVKTLAEQFNCTMSALMRPEGLVRLESVNVIPLLHAVGARQFRYCHREFSFGTGNYFEYVGEKIAAVLIKYSSHRRLSNLWM